MLTACRFLSGKDCRLNYHIKQGDVEKMDLAFERVSDSFKVQNLKDFLAGSTSKPS